MTTTLEVPTTTSFTLSAEDLFANLLELSKDTSDSIFEKGDIVAIPEGQAIGIVREIISPQSAEEEKQDNTDLFGIELLEAPPTTIFENETGCIDNVRYFHTKSGKACVQPAENLVKIPSSTLLEQIRQVKRSTSVSNFSGANERDDEQYSLDIDVGVVILSHNRMGLVVASESSEDGPIFVVDDVIDDGTGKSFSVCRGDIQRIYRPEELFEVVSSLNELQPQKKSKLTLISSIQLAGDVDRVNADWDQSQTFIFCPSVNYPEDLMPKVVGMHLYEAGMFPFVLHLAKPNVKIIMLCSFAMDPAVLEYYLSLSPNMNREDAMSRFKFICLNDFRKLPLTQKIMERPLLVKRLKNMLKNEFASDESHLMVWIKTQQEVELSKMLGIPLYGPTASAEFYGTKAGSRTLFRELRLPHAIGTYEPVYTEEALANDITKLLCEVQQRKTKQETTPDDLTKENCPSRLVLKCNNGFSGVGNAILFVEPILEEYNRLQSMGDGSSFAEIVRLTFASTSVEYGDVGCTWDMFHEWIQSMGCIIEVWLEGVIASPSVNGFMHRSYARTFATHDQILDGQEYLGCTFPCQEKYRHFVINYGDKIANALRRKGGLDTFGVDFVITQSENGELAAYAIEINLRWCGPTYATQILKLATDGEYNHETGKMEIENGEERTYAYFYVQDKQYVGLLPEDVILMLKETRLGWNSETKCGIIMHKLSSFSEFGKSGVVAIGKSVSHSMELLENFKEQLNGWSLGK